MKQPKKYNLGTVLKVSKDAIMKKFKSNILQGLTLNDRDGNWRLFKPNKEILLLVRTEPSSLMRSASDGLIYYFLYDHEIYSYTGTIKFLEELK